MSLEPSTTIFPERALTRKPTSPWCWVSPLLEEKAWKALRIPEAVYSRPKSDRFCPSPIAYDPPNTGVQFEGNAPEYGVSEYATGQGIIITPERNGSDDNRVPSGFSIQLKVSS